MTCIKYHLFVFALLVCWKPTCSNLNIHRSLADNSNAKSDYLQQDTLLQETSFNKNNTSLATYSRHEAAGYALISACLVGLTGIIPLFILPSFKDSELNEEKNAVKLKRLLSFAVGSLLGDVFLHLLPESWEHLHKQSVDGNVSHWASTINGLWILVGLISFCLLEKLVPESVEGNCEDCSEPSAMYHQINDYNANENNNNIDPSKKLLNGHPFSSIDKTSSAKYSKKSDDANHVTTQRAIKTSGYLNLLANCIDNFTHGLAVGGSYLISRRVGVLTTLAILLHEIPHEVGDFAILLRAGFNRWEAMKYQIMTASGGMLGALMAFWGDSSLSSGNQVAWILPFTSGGFIYVALCTVVPDILKETSPRESVIQLLFLLAAVFVMHAVSFIE